MATISAPLPAAADGRASEQSPELEEPQARATLDWGNSAPLALLAFAVTTFMLSMVNANAISAGV